MKQLPIIVFFAGLLSLVVQQSPAQHPPDSSSAGNLRTERTIDSLLALMTLEEKIGQLVQWSGRFADTVTHAISSDQLEEVRRGRVGSLLNVAGATLTNSIQRIAVEESRLKIPLLFGLDVIHGYRTTFPIPLAEASTWDPDLIERAARVAAVEATAAGIHWTFAPMVDIARDPRWGRIAEGSGEDPYLGARMAEARVRGFQGHDLRSTDALLACPKHFAAYGAAEGGRDYNTVDISELTLREIYLPPFEAAIRAGAGTIMCSFNEIAGIPSTGNRKLLTGILRGEWGFDGFVVSDWESIIEMVPHGYAVDGAEAAVLALEAGVDMDMESGLFADRIATAVTSQRISESTLNEAVRRVLRTKIRLGLFENPYRSATPQREQSLLLHPSHRALAREIAGKSMVLLKNQGRILPLSRNRRTIAVIGPLADSRNDCLGPWHAKGRGTDVVTILEGIKANAGEKTEILFAEGCSIQEDDTSGFRQARRVAQRADAVIMVLGESEGMSGEGGSRSSLELPGRQLELVKTIANSGKPVIVILMSGRPLAIPWIAENVPAIIEAWFPGIEAGNAVADVLFGRVNPSGKLPATFPRATGQLPIYYNHKNTGRPGNDRFRFTSRYLDLPVSPLYPFGYGLSYTTFSYTDLTFSADTIRTGEKLVVSVNVKNSGDLAGDEVVQLYLRDEVASVTRPVRMLKRFSRISLAPDSTAAVRFVLGEGDLAFYNSSMERVVEPGTFLLSVGGSSVEGLQKQIVFKQ